MQWQYTFIPDAKLQHRMETSAFDMLKLPHVIRWLITTFGKENHGKTYFGGSDKPTTNYIDFDTAQMAIMFKLRWST